MAVLAAVLFNPVDDKHANLCKLRYRQEYPRAHIFDLLAPHFPSLLTSSLWICRHHGRIRGQDMRGLGKISDIEMYLGYRGIGNHWMVLSAVSKLGLARESS